MKKMYRNCQIKRISVLKALYGFLTIGLLVLMQGQLNAQSYLYEEDFEGTQSDWYSYTANTCPGCGQNLTAANIDADATDEVYAGNESLKAWDNSGGACGTAGAARDFNLTGTADSLIVWVKYTCGNWGRNNIVIKDHDSANHNELLVDNSSGSPGNDVNWTRMSFDISDYSRNFTLIFGNKDESGNNCGNNDHDYAMWVDNIKIKGVVADTSLGITALNSPVSPNSSECGLQNNESLEVAVTNTGKDDIPTGESLSVDYQVNGGTVYSDNFTLSQAVPSGSSTNLSLSQQFDLSAAGTYDVKAWVNYSKDTVALDDTLNATLNNPNEIGLQQDIISPVDKGQYGIETLEVSLMNYTRGTINAGTVIPLVYETTRGGVDTFNHVLNNDLACADSVNIDLGDINLACENTSHEVSVWSVYNNLAGNDTATTVFENPSVFEGFETGAFGNEWNITNFSIEDFESRSGNYSAGMWDEDEVYADFAPAQLQGGKKVESAEFYWYEDGTQSGHYVAFMDDSGEPVLLAGSNNPQWDVSDGGGQSTLYGGDDYERWIHYEFTFDWSNGSYDYRMEDLQSGTVITGTRNLIRSTNIEQLWFRGEDHFSSIPDQFGSGDIVIFDDIRINLAQSGGSNKPSNLSLVGPDTAYINSPVEYFTNASAQAGVTTDWLINGERVGGDQNSIEHAFSQTGKDTVSMLTAGCFGIDTLDKVVEVVTPSRAPTVNFASDVNFIENTERVEFTDLSTHGPVSWDWSISPAADQTGSDTYTFGNSSDTFQDPTVRFLKTGFYEVCLTASNSQGSNTVCRSKYIRVKNQKDICSDGQTTDSIGFVNDGEDGTYPADANCGFLINPCAKAIDLHFEKLDLSNGDYLKVYDGKNAQGTPLWDQQAYGPKGITGDTSHAGFRDSLQATSGAVYVQFVSGSSPSGEGFSLEWIADNQSLPSLSAGIEGDSSICSGEPVTFMANSNSTDADFDWYVNTPINGSPVETGNELTHTFQNSGFDTVKLLTTYCDQVDTSVKIVNSYVPNTSPDVAFEADKRFGSVGDTIVLRDMTEDCVEGRYWELQPASLTYVNNTTSASEQPHIRFEQEGVYNVKLVDTNSGGLVGDTLKSGYIIIRNYCAPVVSKTNQDIAINRLRVSNLEHTTGVPQNGYSDFRDLPNIRLEKGEKAPFTIERNTAFNPVNYKVWIDLNRDGEFQDPNELVASSGAISGSKWDGQLQVPQNINGNYAMRIGVSMSGLSNTPCGENQRGEFEDYTVNIGPDQTPPVIHKAQGDTVELNACESSRNIVDQVYAQDNVDGQINNIQVNGSIDSENPGYYKVKYSAQDNEGNTGVDSQVFRVSPDETKPEFELQGPDTSVVEVHHSLNEPGYTVPSDNCSGIQDFSIDQSQLDTASLGTYPVEYRTVDSAGNERVLTRHVKVVDTTAPTFTLVGDASFTVDVDSGFNDPGINGLNDNYWDIDTLTTTVEGEIDETEIGTYDLTYLVEDPSGNREQKVRKVQVKDTTAPKVKANTGDTITLEVYNELDLEANLTVKDNYSEAILADTSGDFYLNFPNGKADELGVYSLNLTYMDESGNQRSVELLVDVVDREAPDIALKGSAYLTLGRWDTTAYESPDSVVISDNYYRDHQVEVMVAGSYFSAYETEGYINGIFEITYQAEDPSGNVSETVTRTVEVQETTGIEEAKSESGFGVYPNPTKEMLNVEMELGANARGTLEIVNALGKKVRTIEDGPLKTEYQVDLRNESSGVYFLRLVTGDEVQMQRFVISK